MSKADQRVSALADKRNCLTHWYPIVAAKTEVPMPMTTIYNPTNPTLEEWGEAIRTGDKIVPSWIDDLVRQFIEVDGQFPAFMRTDQSSIKHDFATTCFVRVVENLAIQLENMIFKHLGRLGAPTPEAIILREYLAPAPISVNGIEFQPFRAFGRSARLPIGAERRYFVRDEVVECHHPYWPEHAIKGVDPAIVDWRERLIMFNREDEAEITLLTGYAQQIGTALPGYWSVDFMLTIQGWVFIDAALGACSAHLPCPHCPEGQGD